MTTVYAGEKIKSAHNNNLETRIAALELAASLEQGRVKTSDETVSGTSLQNDSDLVVTYSALYTYKFEIGLIYNSPTGTDLIVAVNYTAGSGTSVGIGTDALDVSVSAESGSSYNKAYYNDTVPPTTEITIGGAGTDVLAMFYGVIAVGTTGGSLQVQWAQAVAAGTTTVRRKSFIHLVPFLY